MANLHQKLMEFNISHSNESIKLNDKVMLVDGLNMFIRCFAATPTMDENGNHVGGLTGFLKSLAATARQFHPSRIVIVFDGKGGSQRRRKLFSDYKENRKSMTRLNRTYDFKTLNEEQDSQKEQLYALIKYLDFLPVTVLAPDNVEADDVLAYYANMIQDRGGKAIIVSTDKDFLQLVTDNIKVYNPIRKKIYNPETIVEEYGIHPHNFIVYRVLDGDKSDNIPGIKGIGPATLIKHYPELANADECSWEHIYSVAEQSTSKTLKKLVEGKNIIERNMELMRLDEQQLGGNTIIKIIEQFDQPIKKLNKTGLIRAMVHDKIVDSFGDVEEWIKTVWIPLNRFSKE